MSGALFYAVFDYTSDEGKRALAAHLALDPDEPAKFTDSMFNLVRGLLVWRDYRSPTELILAMCQVCSYIAELRSQLHLSPTDENEQRPD
jgi:hypothetical protein